MKLHDRSDGHGVDWADVAAAAFRVAFSCLDELPPGDEQGAKVARRVHDGAYNRLAGNPDSGTAYTSRRHSPPSGERGTIAKPAPSRHPDR